MPREKAPQVHAATYVAETRTIDSLPPVGPPEIAIAGRSNVGKSTLLNRLAGRLKLARTSKTPGRTRGMVFYDLRVAAASGPRELRLADLPGFGYAKVSQAERASWQPLIEGYVERRPTLALFVVLIDSRRGAAAEEQQLLEWLAALRVPAQVVFTKADKLSATEKGALKASAKTQPRTPGPRPLLISAETGDGIDDLWASILRALPGGEPSDGGEIAGTKTPA